MKPPSLKIWFAAFLVVELALTASISALERLEPEEGCYIGASVGARDTIERFSARVGFRPAVCVQFFEFPLAKDSRGNLINFLKEVRSMGGIALITLEPNAGLSNVTQEASFDLAQILSNEERQGIGGIMVRFAHEMNGNWNPWGQQPVLYKDKFRLLAKDIRAGTARTAMLWAPSYGGGYPFGAYRMAPGTPDFAALDTNGDGVLSQDDDAYEPYYPGDDAVDWVGLTLYHWGVQWPWLENELPEPNSFANLLTGNYAGGNGDQTAVPDFYAQYCADGVHDKPLAIPETAAFFNPHQGGATELGIKEAWCHQLFNISGDTPEAVDVAQHFPKLKCISWFDHYKLEPEQNQWIDWRISAYAPVRAAFVGHVRTLRNGRQWFLTASDLDCLQRPFCITDGGLPAILPLTGSVTLSLRTKAQTDCELVVDLVDGNLQRQAGTRTSVSAGLHAADLTCTIDRMLTDGAPYHWSIRLQPLGKDDSQALADYESVEAVARAITPTIQIVAFPPVLASLEDFAVRVKYAAAESSFVAVNLLDNSHNSRGSGTATVDRGGGIVDVPVTLRTNMANGNYTLESFLTNSSTNRQNSMARSRSFPVRVIPLVKQDSINAMPQPAMLAAGEVFRFAVEYAAITNRDLHIDLFDVNTNFLAGALQPVSSGSGVRDMTISYPLAPPGGYFMTAFLTPTGQSWEQAIAWSADRRITVVGWNYQEWIESHWGVVLASDAVSPQDDPDGDGVTNADEFAALTDPRYATEVLRAEVIRTEPGLAVRWRSVAGRHYQLFQASDLSKTVWAPVGRLMNGTGSMLQIAIGWESAATFYRVQAVP